MCARIINFLSLAVLLLATACSSSSTTIVPSPVVTNIILDTPTQPVTVTPVPSQTPLPTLTPTITRTLLPSVTPTITPDPALSQIELLGLSWYQNYDLLLSFQFPGAVDPKDYRVTLEEKEYSCETITGYPDRLYCRGQGAKVLAEAWIRIYPQASDQVGYEKAVWIPYFDNNYDSFYSTNP